MCWKFLFGFIPYVKHDWGKWTGRESGLKYFLSYHQFKTCKVCGKIKSREV